MINPRINQTITATIRGTNLVMVDCPTSTPPSDGWLIMAIDTTHHVSAAFIVAASNQAPNSYHTSAG